MSKSNNTEPFSCEILLWYYANQRDLPWRQTKDPYKIWVSEVILQQTRVAQGLDCYLRFTEKFPTIESLANASEDEVLHQWQGMGYYSRARNLRTAAQQVMEQFDGIFPQTYEGIRSLRGVGGYTASAVAAFAYGIPRAAVDGNVCRVLSRHFGITDPIDSSTGKRTIAELAQNLIPKDKRCADFNQGLMDFGSMVCTPMLPRCQQCPVAESCRALADGTTEMLPIKRTKTKTTRRCLTYVFVVSPQGLLLHRRGEGDIWQGLYEPMLMESPNPLPLVDVVKQPQFSNIPNGGVWMELKTNVKHVLTHRVLSINFYRLTLPHSFTEPDDYHFVALSETEQYAMPQVVKKMLPLALT